MTTFSEYNAAIKAASIKPPQEPGSAHARHQERLAKSREWSKRCKWAEIRTNARRPGGSSPAISKEEQNARLVAATIGASQ